MCLFKIRGATKWQDASVSFDTYVLFNFPSPKSPEAGIFSWGNVAHLAISFKLYELDPLLSSISVVLIHEMGVFTYSSTSVGSGGLFVYISCYWVIFTYHVLTIAFIPVTLFISLCPSVRPSFSPSVCRINCVHSVSSTILARSFFIFTYIINQHQGPLLLTWFNFNPSTDK